MAGKESGKSSVPVKGLTGEGPKEVSVKLTPKPLGKKGA